MRMKSLFMLFAALSAAAGARYGGGHGRGFVCGRGRHEPDGFRATFPGSSEVAFGKHRHRSRWRSPAKHEYVCTVIRFLEAKYWRHEGPFSKTDVVHALELIYEMLHQNFHGLVVFTAHVVFGTGGLLRLQAGCEQWASRGILQITGKENYKKLARITRSDFFLRHPEALATLQRRAVEAAVFFWLCLLDERFSDYRQAEIHFWETLLLLNPDEVRWPPSPKGNARIQNREADYNALLDAFRCPC